jgi:hypothetical protein
VSLGHELQDLTLPGAEIRIGEAALPGPPHLRLGRDTGELRSQMIPTFGENVDGASPPRRRHLGARRRARGGSASGWVRGGSRRRVRHHRA